MRQPLAAAQAMLAVARGGDRDAAGAACCSGCGWTGIFVEVPVAAVEGDRSAASRPRSRISTPSSRRVRLSSWTMPWPTNSSGRLPRPMPTTRRPPLRMSRVAVSSARRIGLWNGQHVDGGADADARRVRAASGGGEDATARPTGRSRRSGARSARRSRSRGASDRTIWSSSSVRIWAGERSGVAWRKKYVPKRIGSRPQLYEFSVFREPRIVRKRAFFQP